MNNFKIKYLIVFLALGFVLFTSFSDTFPERPKTGFRAMEGTLVTHYFEEKTDSLSGPELFELQDENGLPIWFGQIHQKTVLNLLEMFSSQKIGVGAYNLILRLVTSEHINKNEQIAQKLNGLSEDENGYVRNLTKRTLSEKQNSY